MGNIFVTPNNIFAGKRFIPIKPPKLWDGYGCQYGYQENGDRLGCFCDCIDSVTAQYVGGEPTEKGTGCLQVTVTVLECCNRSKLGKDGKYVNMSSVDFDVCLDGPWCFGSSPLNMLTHSITRGERIPFYDKDGKIDHYEDGPLTSEQIQIGIIAPVYNVGGKVQPGTKPNPHFGPIFPPLIIGGCAHLHFSTADDEGCEPPPASQQLHAIKFSICNIPKECKGRTLRISNWRTDTMQWQLYQCSHPDVNDPSSHPGDVSIIIV